MQHLLNKLRGVTAQSPSRPAPQSDPTRQQPKLSLTEHLLQSTRDEYRLATQSAFLRLAAEGRLPKPVLGRWLAGERLYLHACIRAAGKLLAGLDLPRRGGETPAGSGSDRGEAVVVVRLVDWVVEDLVRIREEERRIVDVARRYGIVLLEETGETGHGGVVPGPGTGSVRPRAVVVGRSVGLRAGEEGVGSGAAGTSAVSRPDEPAVLPWLEAAVMFWGTERVFVDAWSWARAQQQDFGDGGDCAGDDADGGALRRELIPAWSGDGLKEFVARLRGIIDEAVTEEIEKGGNVVREELMRRTAGKWRSLISGAGAFWTEVEEG